MTLPKMSTSRDIPGEPTQIVTLTAALDAERATVARLREALTDSLAEYSSITAIQNMEARVRALLADTAADAERWLAEVRRLAVEEALSVERIADALFEMHAGPTVVEEKNGRPIWEGFGWSRGPSPDDVKPEGMWGPKLREAFATALRAALLSKGERE